MLSQSASLDLSCASSSANDLRTGGSVSECCFKCVFLSNFDFASFFDIVCVPLGSSFRFTSFFVFCGFEFWPLPEDEVDDDDDDEQDLESRTGISLSVFGVAVGCTINAALVCARSHFFAIRPASSAAFSITTRDWLVTEVLD